MSETAQAYQWIDTTLKADTALMAVATAVRQGYADINTRPPFVVYARQSGQDIMTMNATRLWASILVQVKAVGPITSYAALVMMAGRIDALFANVRNVALPGGGGLLSSYREQEFAMSELVAGAQWENLGGLYRIALQGS